MKLLPLLLIVAAFLAPSQDPSAVQQQQRQREEDARREAERVAVERQRQQEEENRRRQMEQIIPASVGLPKIIPFVRDPGVCSMIQEDRRFDVQSIPLKEWIAGKDVAEIPWKVQIQKPQLRMDQRQAVAYSAAIRLKNVNGATTSSDLVFVSGVNTMDGRSLIAPKAATQPVEAAPVPEIQVRFNDCLFARPGEYVLWMVLYDIKTKKHNVAKQRIQVPELKNDPLPHLNSKLPAVEFPQLDGPNSALMSAIPGRFVLPVLNRKPVAVDLFAIVSPSEQWPGRPDIINSQTRRVLAAVTTLAQMQLSAGSISVTAVDLVQRRIAFEQKSFQELDWKNLAAAFTRPRDAAKITVTALETSKDRGAFFREVLKERLGNPQESFRVIVVISNNQMLEPGSDLKPLQLEGDCRCRFYHIRFPLNKDDVFDDIGKVLQRPPCDVHRIVS
jgi:hypothetical protein